MRSFTWEIKRDLLAVAPSQEALSAVFSAFLSTGGTAGSSTVIIENERIAEYFLSVSERIGLSAILTDATSDAMNKRDRLLFSYDAEKAQTHYVLPPDPVEDGEEISLSYIKAAFLGGGSCTLPQESGKSGYHLEFRFFDEETARHFLTTLDGFSLIGRVLKHRERHIVYLKSREAISDFLSVVGAESALRRFESVSEAREESNNQNRTLNCLAGNADRAATASAALAVAIRRLEEDGRLSELSAPLRETAEARLRYPSLSLGELAQKLGIGKSCLNHRLRKLMSVYDGK